MNATLGNLNALSPHTPARYVPAAEQYVLRLYLTGTSYRSLQALKTVKLLCEQHLKGRYDLEVVDLFQQPDRACAAGILAAPTLVRELPAPRLRYTGDFSDSNRVQVALNLRSNHG